MRKPNERKADRITWIAMAGAVVVGAAGHLWTALVIVIAGIAFIIWTTE